MTAFIRSNKGVTVTREGEELLSFARMLLGQSGALPIISGIENISAHGAVV